MKCIDFDKAFQQYMTAYFKENKTKYKDYDAMEAAMPDLYQAFLAAPAAFLAGAAPGTYFQSFSDAKALVNWMEDYIKQRVPLPDMLLNRIAELGEPAERALLDTLKKELAPIEAKMTAVGLLKELQSVLPLPLYIDWQLNRQEEDELADNALESLKEMGEAAHEALNDALGRACDAGRAALLDALVEFPVTDEVLTATLDFLKRGDRRAVFAGYLEKLGDERALPELLAAASAEELQYWDYIEIRSAIEALGGEAPIRVFGDDDPAYAALRRMDENNPEHIHNCDHKES